MRLSASSINAFAVKEFCYEGTQTKIRRSPLLHWSGSTADERTRLGSQRLRRNVENMRTVLRQPYMCMRKGNKKSVAEQRKAKLTWL